MAERFNATVLKTVVAQVTLSSNLSPSAMNNNQSQATEIFFVIQEKEILFMYEDIYFELYRRLCGDASIGCILALLCQFSYL